MIVSTIQYFVLIVSTIQYFVLVTDMRSWRIFRTRHPLIKEGSRNEKRTLYISVEATVSEYMMKIRQTIWWWSERKVKANTCTLYTNNFARLTGFKFWWMFQKRFSRSESEYHSLIWHSPRFYDGVVKQNFITLVRLKLARRWYGTMTYVQYNISSSKGRRSFLYSGGGTVFSVFFISWGGM